MENEHDEPEQETLDFTKPAYSFSPKATHGWRQSGYYLVCQSCELEHGVYVGEHKIMVGVTETGDPVLKTRAELGMA